MWKIDINNLIEKLIENHWLVKIARGRMENTVFCPFISHIDVKITGFIGPGGGGDDKREKNIM